MPECDRAAFRDPIWERADEVSEIVEKGARFSKLKSLFEATFVESAWMHLFANAGMLSPIRDALG